MSTGAGRWRRVTAACVVSVLIGLVTLAYLGRHDFNPTALFRIGDRLPLSPRLSPEDVVRFPGELGYDGQFYLTIALDPLLSDPGTTRALDVPRYRYRRILFPVLGWMLSGGRPALVPWALLTVLLTSFTGLALTLGELGRLRRCRGPGELLALALVGAWVSLLLGTAGLLSAFLLAQALLGYELGQGRRTWVALALAGLARETSLLLVPAFVFAGARRSGRRAALATVTAAVPALVWNVWVLVRVPAGNAVGVAGRLAWPFLGLTGKLSSLPAAPMSAKGGFETFMFLSLLLAAAGVLWAGVLRIHEAPHLAGLAVLLCALLACAGPRIVDYYVGYCRIFLDLFVVAAVLAMSVPRSLSLWIALGVQALGSLAYVLHVVTGLG
jgi:hypothetical protein